MITARRESNGFYDSLNRENGGVAVLEREQTVSDVSETKTRQESIEDVRERMKKNLAMILNYDKPSVLEKETSVQEKTEDFTESPVAEAQEEDIRPTTTTMQFGDGDVNQMFNELKTHEKEEHAVAGKTKLAIFLYAIAVTVILALIVINTGVLSVINAKSQLKQAELESIITEYNMVSEDLAAHGDDYVINVAVNELGMIR